MDFEVNPGNAWQDYFDANGNMMVHFEKGKTEALEKVTTKRVPNTTGTLTFTAELVNTTNGGLNGLNSPAEINIFDTLVQLKRQFAAYVYWYHHMRMHSSLGYISLVMFKNKRKQKITP